MRRHLTSISTETTGQASELVCQKEAIRIMRVAGRKSRYAEAFAIAGLTPELVTGNCIMYRKDKVQEARIRLDEIERRKLADHQGTLPLQAARTAVVNTLAAAVAKAAAAPAPLPAQPPKEKPATGVTIRLVIEDANMAAMPWEKINQTWHAAAKMAAGMGYSDLLIHIK